MRGKVSAHPTYLITLSGYVNRLSSSAPALASRAIKQAFSFQDSISTPQLAYEPYPKVTPRFLFSSFIRNSECYTCGMHMEARAG
jgi:hypothetical protein